MLKLLVTFGVTLILIKLLIRYAPTLGLIDVPNHRSVHADITPRGAGIGMVLGVILSDILFFNTAVFENIATFLAILLVFVVGILDDHKDTTPKTKFYVIFFAVMLLLYDGVVITSLGDLFGYRFELEWIAIPFTVFAVAGFTNAMNLSDGLDGLAGMLSIIILSILCAVGYRYNDVFIVMTSATFIAAVLAFMVFNWHPARIFMGDSGSLTLGFVVSILSIKAITYIPPISILLIAALPILDTLIVMIRRKRKGHSIFTPDKLHIHHVLLHFFNGNVRKTVLVISLIQTGFSIAGFAFAEESSQQYVLIFFIINAAVFYTLLNGMIERQNKFRYYRNKKKK